MRDNVLGRRIFVKWIALLLLSLFAVCEASAVVGVNDFWNDVIDKWSDFLHAAGHKITILNEFPYAPTETQVHQGRDTIAVEYVSGGDGFAIFFKTRDPKMIFLGNLKVGDSLKDAIQKKKIPGKMTKLDNVPGGQQAYQWQLAEDVTFTVYAKGDTIAEFVYFSPTIQDGDRYKPALGVDVATIDYVR
jgi:hypothetical protein